MKNAIQLLLLIFTLTVGLIACNDNDLTSGKDHTGGTEDSAQIDQKYEMLSGLLNALADVDSLPQNWESDSYTVEPTIGIVNNEATPHVRYITTTSTEEADRIYRSFVSKDVTGTATNDSWSMEGIGSMTFEVNNQTDLYATLKVNVKQLPNLEEIRFVPNSALGNNWGFKPTGCFYNFGDVICQKTKGADGSTKRTYWVCVRPCSTEACLRKTHWCTFQMNAYNEENPNYKKIKKNLIPQNLCSKKSNGERFVQNFFNVLLLIANPQFADESTNYQGIGEIKANKFSYDTIRAVSYLWDCLDLWNKDRKDENGNFVGGVVNRNYNMEDLPTYLGNSMDVPVVRAVYYSEKASIFSNFNYNVYNLVLTNSIYNTDQKSSLFNTVKKSTLYIDETDNDILFNKLETGYAKGIVYYDNNWHSYNLGSHQFIVRHKTGGELEGLSESKNDVDPAHSFTLRQAQNGIEDVLVAENLLDKTKGEEGYRPFFAFGDEVTETKNYEAYQFCIRTTNNEGELEGAESVFLTEPDPYELNKEDKPSTELDVAATREILCHLLNAYLTVEKKQDICQVNEKKSLPTSNNCQTNYLDALKRLYEKFIKTGYVECSDEGNEYQVGAKINGQYYVVTWDKFENKLYFDLTETSDDCANLSAFSYYEVRAYREKYSKTRTLYVKKKNERESLQDNVSEYIKELLENSLN